MPRQYFIHPRAAGRYSVVEKDGQAPHEFGDMLEAVRFVREQRFGKELMMTLCDERGEATFSQMIYPLTP
jgi:hypothetical protein